MNRKDKMSKILHRIGISLILGTTLWGSTISAVKAVRLADGTVAFANPPKLLDAITTFRAVRSRNAKYYFSFSFPKTAEESIQKITINLRRGGDNINYNLDKTIAAVGAARKRTQDIPISETTFDENTQIVTVTFANPIPAGTNFTVGLRPKRNPDFGGNYQFGVTAFPAGEKSQGIYLGSARLQFDDSDDSDFGS